MVSALQSTYEQGSIGISVACVPDETAQGTKTRSSCLVDEIRKISLCPILRTAVLVAPQRSGCKGYTSYQASH